MQTAKPIHWHILGAGAIGTLVAFKLSQQLLTFSFIGRSNKHAIEPRYFTDLNGVKHGLLSTEREEINYLIICTKSTQALDAFASIQARLSPNCVVICLFNGLGAQQAIKQGTNCPVFFATTTEGVSKIATASYAYKGAGETYIDLSILQYIPAKYLPKFFTLVDNIDERITNKLVINSLINPLTAIFDCENGQLLSNPQAMAIMQLLADEIANWLSAYQQDTSASGVLILAKKVMQATANNSSSMRQDIKLRQVSEIDLINGYWVKNNPKNIDLQHNMRIIEQIKILESKFT